MRVLLVSGIFAMPEEFRRRNLQETTETLLLAGLREGGVDVSARGHGYVDSWRGFDVVHLNHLANGCVRMVLPQPQRVVFSRHATKPIPVHHRLVLAATYRHSDAVVVSSEMERARLDGVVAESKTHVIYNGINSANFPASVRERPSAQEPWRFLYVGQLIELKRVELAIRLLALLTQRGERARLDIVSQRETLRPELEALAAELGIGDRVQFLGPKTRAETGELMRRAHALVLPSRTEALPTVVTEAVVSGLPVIAFQVGGISEQLPPGQTLPAIQDIQGFYDLGVSLVRDYPSIVARYAAHAMVARDRFSIARMVDAHVRVYRSLVEPARRQA